MERETSIPTGWCSFSDKELRVNIDLTQVIVAIFLLCCSTKENISVKWVYLTWQRIYKQCEGSRNGVTRDQVVQMKQNANTPVTQLQYFHMHMLQTCLGRTTTVFAHVTRWRIKFLFWHTSQQSITFKTIPQEEKSELGITLDKITVLYIYTDITGWSVQLLTMEKIQKKKPLTIQTSHS